MIKVLPVCLVTAALAAPVLAQDATTRTRTEVKADDAKAVFMRGCLTQNTLNGRFELSGATVQTGDDLVTKSKVETDVDRDKTTVEGKATAKVDDAKTVGTAGIAAIYEVTPRQGVNLATHVGHQVVISGVVVEAGRGDADVTVKEQVKTDADNARDTEASSKTKLEIEKGPLPQFAAVSVNPVGTSCTR